MFQTPVESAASLTLHNMIYVKQQAVNLYVTSFLQISNMCQSNTILIKLCNIARWF